ncbi:MAG: hypothetical protein VYE73_12355 [Acidobacteriota bacterium]|nr:hypothetical protein [Acidobacteriota bacterium]
MELFRFGYLPDNFTREERRSFGKFRDAYLAASRYFSWRFEVVEVPFEGNQIVVHLHRPIGVDRPPLVLYTGGMDGSKESGRGAAAELVARGFSLLHQGVVGSGEKTISTPLLILNGGRDTLSPIRDMKMLEAAAEDAEMWIFGLAGHCGGRYGALFSEDVIRWLVERL